jgi:hypothetical protein
VPLLAESLLWKPKKLDALEIADALSLEMDYLEPLMKLDARLLVLRTSFAPLICSQ